MQAHQYASIEGVLCGHNVSISDEMPPRLPRLEVESILPIGKVSISDEMPPRLPLKDIEPIYRVIGHNIRAQRRLWKLSQGDVAACLGLARASSLCDIEHGRVRIAAHTLHDIATFFGVTVDSLLEEAEP